MYSASNTAPIKKSACSEGGCMVNVGQDACSASACTCLGLCLAPVCGPFQPAACQANPNIVYYCPGDRGSHQNHCGCASPDPNVSSSPRPWVPAAVSTNASARATKWSARPSSRLSAGMSTTRSTGALKVVFLTLSSWATLRTLAPRRPEAPFSGPIFEPNGYACYEDRKLCGSSFGMNCRLTPDMLYTCSRGKNPVPSNLCFLEHCARPARGRL